MEAVDCKTAGQLLGGAISPPINHYNHGESPHLNACLCTSNLNLPCSGQTSCKKLDGYKHHCHKRWHRTTLSCALLVYFRTEGVTQSVIGFSMRPGDSLPSQHQAICARISPQIPKAQTILLLLTVNVIALHHFSSYYLLLIQTWSCPSSCCSAHLIFLCLYRDISTQF